MKLGKFYVPIGVFFILAIAAIGLWSHYRISSIFLLCAIFWVGIGVGTIQNTYERNYRRIQAVQHRHKGLKLFFWMLRAWFCGPYAYKLLYSRSR